MANEPYTAFSSEDLFFRPVAQEDLPAVAAIEQAGFPVDEAASPETLGFRQREAGHCFLVALKGDEVIGYACGTLTKGSQLSHETMYRHDPTGGCLCVHSLCVAKEQQRRGLGPRIMRTYINYVRSALPQVDSIKLICKQDLIRFYERSGFHLLGPSEVVHGKDQWYEMQLLTSRQESKSS
ncbi:hypothetical protein KFL_001790140 [Klebsormidium nitens]|uniref:N-acetyltransferase domain-containing protein n=1 Tax=Klebsormidium nitens TaxID=105231 RepID=A0A1Y1HZU2_KLENI|nr:hypothetical protein KFL_001790140 [Klebsormidium nitens]|eukprot:GAQ84175.1 hypothetical protein KFL_001790140 [Klebsormidium nitens]